MAYANGQLTSTADYSCQGRNYEKLAVLILLGIQSILLTYSATTHSPTQLEPAFLASGISHWSFERFELYRVNPPLVRMIAALPVLAAGAETDWSHYGDAPGSRPEFQIGSDFIKVNGPFSVPLFYYARFVCIPFTLIGGYFAFRWAKELYGSGAGLLTLTLYTFEPNLLAHGELITPDAACISFGIMAGYTFWKWLKSPTWVTAVLAGVSLGLAELTKMTWLILFALWPALWFVWRLLAPKRSPPSSGCKRFSTPPPVTQLALILLLSIYMLNLFYLFDGSGTPLEEFKFVSKSLNGQGKSGEVGNRFKGSVLGKLPVPFPEQYVLGFDAQKKDFEDFHENSYLRGESKAGGWWYYYIYGLLVKVPCGTWFLLGSVLIWRNLNHLHHAAFRDEMILIVPATFLLIFVSSQTEINIHLRYVFPTLGFGLVFIGQSAFLFRSQLWWVRTFPVAFVLFSSISSLLDYPHHLAYFNEFIGGPLNGHKHLLGSSLDWGQDLLLLARHEEGHPEFEYVAPPSSLYSYQDLKGAGKDGQPKKHTVRSMSTYLDLRLTSRHPKRLFYTLYILENETKIVH